MSERKWITDRRPTEADADKNDQVLAWVLDNGYKDHPRWVFRHYTNVEVGQPWLPTPEPYTIDTSLAASIERIKNNYIRRMDCSAQCNCDYCDIERIIEAAKKWDVIANKGLKEDWSSCADGEPSQEAKPEASYPVRKSKTTGVWMASTDNSESAARRVAVDCMFALGLDPSDFKTRDKIITGISDRIDGMLNYLSRDC